MTCRQVPGGTLSLGHDGSSLKGSPSLLCNPQSHGEVRQAARLGATAPIQSAVPTISPHFQTPLGVGLQH